MNSINIGYIQETKENNKKKYRVSLFDDVDYALFNNVKDAIKFFKYHALAIFNYNDFNSLHIQFLHLNDVVHYLIFKKNDDREIIVFEETKFDFLRTHPHKFTKYRLRRMINEKNYSFSDVYRAAINWHPFYSIWNSILSILLLIGSGFFLIYGLNFLTKNDSNFSIVDKVILFLSFFTSIIIVSVISIIQQKTRFTLFIVFGDFKEIDWRKWYIIRMSQLIVSILVFLISSSIIFFFVYKSFWIDNDFTIVLVVNFLIWIVHFVSSFSMIIYSQQRKKNALKKHFTKKEIELFRKWARNPEKEEIFKLDDIFLFHDKYSNNETRKEINETAKIITKISSSYLKKIRKKELRTKQVIIEAYGNYLKGITNDNISKNNK